VLVYADNLLNSLHNLIHSVAHNNTNKVLCHKIPELFSSMQELHSGGGRKFSVLVLKEFPSMLFNSLLVWR